MPAERIVQLVAERLAFILRVRERARRGGFAVRLHILQERRAKRVEHGFDARLRDGGVGEVRNGRRRRRRRRRLAVLVDLRLRLRLRLRLGFGIRRDGVPILVQFRRRRRREHDRVVQTLEHGERGPARRDDAFPLDGFPAVVLLRRLQRHRLERVLLRPRRARRHLPRIHGRTLLLGRGRRGVLVEVLVHRRPRGRFDFRLGVRLGFPLVGFPLVGFPLVGFPLVGFPLVGFPPPLPRPFPGSGGGVGGGVGGGGTNTSRSARHRRS